MYCVRLLLDTVRLPPQRAGAAVVARATVGGRTVEVGLVLLE